MIFKSIIFALIFNVGNVEFYDCTVLQFYKVSIILLFLQRPFLLPLL